MANIRTSIDFMHGTIVTPEWFDFVDSRVNETVSVLDFEAVGDGSTDDTAAIQAALDTGKDVYVPRVTTPASQYYKLTSALTMSSNQRLFGDGAASILRQTTANANVISIAGKTNAHVEGLQLYCVGSKSSLSDGGGVYLNSTSTYCSVRKCVIKNHLGTGIIVRDSNDCLIDGNWLLSSPATTAMDHDDCGSDIAVIYNSSRNIVSNNICISGQGRGIVVETVGATDVADDNIITSNVVKSCKIYGIMAYRNGADDADTDSLDNTVIANNIVKDISGAIVDGDSGNYIFGTGIYVQGAENTVVDGNTVINTHSGAVSFTETLAPGCIGATNVTRVTISNNRCDTDVAMHGIEVNDANDNGATTGYCIIANNDIRNVAKSGIEVKERHRVKVIGNTIDTSVRGIHIKNSADATQYEGITISDNDVLNTSNTGILVDKTISPVITGNRSQDSATRGIAVTDSTDALIVGNSVIAQATTGIEVESTVVRGLVDGNIVRGSSSTEGISLDAFVTIGNNEVTGCTTAWVGDYAVLRGVADTAVVGNVGSGEDNLKTFTLPASCLTESNKGVQIKAWGSTANNSNPKTVKLYFGTAAILTTALTVSQAGVWRIEAQVIRSSSANTQKYFAQLLQGGTTTLVDCETGSLTETETAAITIKCTGTVTDGGGGINNDDITQSGLLVTLIEN